MQSKNTKDKIKKETNIFELLKDLTDHRRGQGQRYEYPTLVLMTIMGIMSGAKSERSISRFVMNNGKDLVEQLKIERGEVPKRHVFVNLIRELDFKSLENIFYNWSKEFVAISKNDWVSIDGKAIKGTFPNSNKGLDGFVSLVSVFASKSKQVLKVGKINTHKENEIPKVQDLIKSLNLQGVIFTLDAHHCQEKTVKAVIKSKNNYVIGLKNNQKKLLAQVKKISKTKKV
jgi:DDE_Tnp_1-associated/Transposase DDE domain